MSCLRTRWISVQAAADQTTESELRGGVHSKTPGAPTALRYDGRKRQPLPLWQNTADRQGGGNVGLMGLRGATSLQDKSLTLPLPLGSRRPQFHCYGAKEAKGLKQNKSLFVTCTNMQSTVKCVFIPAPD